jgi:GNAT superfamily N-acetyltransferase
MDGLAEIRRARMEDCAGLARVQVDSYRTAYAGIFPQSYLDAFTYEEQEGDWRDLLASGGDDILCVAESHSGEIVGYALGRPGSGGVEPYDSELVAWHVRRLYQRRGIGRRLVAAVAGQLKREGCRSLMLWVLEENPTRTIYQRMGGRLLDVQQTSHGAVEVAYGWPDIESLCRNAPGS